MKTYTAVVEKCPTTNLFVGYVPGFPGAHSQGETLDELNRNLREVIECFWIISVSKESRLKMDFDHNKLIAAVAKQTLLPGGLKRKGKSRLYYDDNGWWCTIVEFQPSGFSKGSFLNVGVSWLLYEEDYWSFNVGSRELGFSSSENEIEFKNSVFEMAMRAKEIVEYNRLRFSTISKAHEYYQSIKCEGWDCYYAAVIAGLNHQYSIAEKNFSSLFEFPETTEWQIKLNSRSRELMRLLGRPREFAEAVIQIVLSSRTLHRPENKELTLLGLPSIEEF